MDTYNITVNAGTQVNNNSGQWSIVGGGVKTHTSPCVQISWSDLIWQDVWGQYWYSSFIECLTHVLLTLCVCVWFTIGYTFVTCCFNGFSISVFNQPSVPVKLNWIIFQWKSLLFSIEVPDLNILYGSGCKLKQNYLVKYTGKTETFTLIKCIMSTDFISLYYVSWKQYYEV